VNGLQERGKMGRKCCT